MVYTDLGREEEYYRPGTWKIYFRRVGINYIETITRADSTSFELDTGPEYIKFVGQSAEELSLKVLQQMQKENETT